MRCVNCHAPLKQQVAEVRRWMPRGSFDERRGAAVGLDLTRLTLPHEGVGCAVCHVRNGGVLGGEAAGGKFHPTASGVEQAPPLSDPAFCAGCHQFQFHEMRQGQMVITDTPIQNTYEEWRSFRASGGEGTCQSCHMPGGSHAFPGARDLNLLRASLEVELARGAEGFELILRSRGVGHSFPTGDLFRHLTVEVAEAGRPEFRVVQYIGRTYESLPNPQTGQLSKVLTEDTSLRPGASLRVRIESRSGDFKYRVRYHYVESAKESAEALSPDSRPVVLLEGRQRGNRR
jgi:hypothetical protein